jgi:hypothetical protein
MARMSFLRDPARHSNILVMNGIKKTNRKRRCNTIGGVRIGKSCGGSGPAEAPDTDHEHNMMPIE